MLDTASEYLVSHTSGAVGRFTAALALGRGERVVVTGGRGLELGVVLCAATPRHARLLGDTEVGRVLRRTTAADEAEARRLRTLADRLFEDGRRVAAEHGLPIEILDVDLRFDGRLATVQHLRAADCDCGPFVEALSSRYGLEVLLENLAPPTAPEEEEEHGGCGEPGCGRAEGGGGCTSCGTGGCSSCGSGKVDMRAYFAHLRSKMEQSQRMPLL